MKLFYIILFLIISAGVNAQLADKPIKLIPEVNLKIGSQTPAIGGQFTLTGGLMLNEYFFAGIGGGFATDMGMGGNTFPLYFDGRFYFKPKNSFLFKSKDVENNFQIDFQFGADINPDKVYKTGILAGIGFSYKFDFLEIKEVKFPPFYFGLNVEYNYSKYYDEYRGFVLKDGYLAHTMLNIKLAFDIPSFYIAKK